MTNAEKYKTAKERIKEFWDFYTGSNLAFNAVDAFAHWLVLEAPAEKPLPCPFCGCSVACGEPEAPFSVTCLCGYSSPRRDTEDAAIAAHNRVARAAKEANDANA